MAVTGYIIEKYNNMASSYTCHRLVDEGQAAGMQMRIVGAQDCYLVGDQVYNHGEALPPVDFVINRYKWGHVKDALNALAGRSYNGKEAFNLYVNKYERDQDARMKCIEAHGCKCSVCGMDFEKM